MRGIAITARPGRTRVADALAAVAALLYFAVVYQVLWRGGSVVLFYVMIAPPIVAPFLVFRRRPMTSTQRGAFGACAMTVLAVLTWFIASASPITVLAIPLMVIASLAVVRFPVTTVAVLFLFAGAYGSLQALFAIPSAKLTDPLLGGLWLGAGWFWLTGRSRHRARMWIGIVLLALYATITAAGIVTTYSTTAGLQSFRGSAWYLGAAVLVAYAPWDERTRRKLVPTAVLVVSAVGAYCAFRWFVGPAGAEETLAMQSPNNYLDGELRPIGSLATTKELAAWSAASIPFLAAIALTRRDRFALAAAAGFAACVVAMVAADVRAGVAASVAGLVAVLVLYQLAQAFRGRRGAAVVVGAAVAIALGGGAFAYTIGDKSDSSNRYEAILDPTSDASYQARVFKWRSALRDIDNAPFGHGVGTAGRIQVRYGRFRNIGSIDVDNSYLKVAYEQGFFVMALLVGGLLLVLGQLALRAITTLDPSRAGPAIAACGTFVALLVLFFVGEYIEGLEVLSAWLLVGLGLSQFTLEPRAPATQADV